MVFSILSGKKVMVSYDVLGRTRDLARSDSSSCRATSKGPLSVLERSRRAVQKSSSEARAHGLIFALECNACLCEWRVRPLASRSKRTGAWILSETSDPAPHAAVAPVDEEIGRAEAPASGSTRSCGGRGQKRLKECGSSEKPVTLQQPGEACVSWDNHSVREDSRVAASLKTCVTG